MTTEWPHWLPKSLLEYKRLTEEQINYIKPVFNESRHGSLDGVELSFDGKGVVGMSSSIKQFMKRFDHFDAPKGE